MKARTGYGDARELQKPADAAGHCTEWQGHGNGRAGWLVGGCGVANYRRALPPGDAGAVFGFTGSI